MQIATITYLVETHLKRAIMSPNMLANSVKRHRLRIYIPMEELWIDGELGLDYTMQTPRKSMMQQRVNASIRLNIIFVVLV